MAKKKPATTKSETQVPKDEYPSDKGDVDLQCPQPSPQLPPPPKNRRACIQQDPPRKNVLLLSCVDLRLIDQLVHFMDGLNLQNRYDQFKLAGSSMGAFRLSSSCSPSSTGTISIPWKQLFFDHFEALVTKLNRPIKDVFIIDHLDCGAYEKLYPDQAKRKAYSAGDNDKRFELHKTELIAFAEVVHCFVENCKDKFNQNQTNPKEQQPDHKENPWEDIRISCFVMDLLGKVHQVCSANSQLIHPAPCV